jgi:DNA-binding IclR family transcriptional regulator
MGAESPPTDRVVSILNALADEPDRPLTVSELAKLLRLSTATCHAIVGRLTASGYLLPTGGRSKRYALGPQVMAIGRAAQRSLVPSTTASASLQELSDEVGYPCSIRTKVQHVVLVVERAGEPEIAGKDLGERYTFAPPVGTSFVLWGTEEIKQEWIAQAPFPLPPEEDEQLAIIAASSVRRGYAVHRLVSETRRQLHLALAGSSGDDLADEPLSGLLAELLKTAWTGAILLDGLDAKASLPIAAVSAPVYDADGLARWIVEVHVNDELSVRSAERIGRELAKAANDITASIGGRGAPPA